MLSVVRQKRFIWEKSGDVYAPVNYDTAARPMRQNFEGLLVENGAFYITSKPALKSTGIRISGRIGVYEMDESSYFEIDEPSDWAVAEVLAGRLKLPAKDITDIDIKLFVTDCDGVLTDGGMYYAECGDELKKFNATDGMGFELLRKNGIKTAIISSESNEILSNRAKKIKADYLFTGVKDKLPVLKDLAEKCGVDLDNIAYVGDDINDVSCIAACGFGATVPGACAGAKEAADYITKKTGGSGAVREVIDKIISDIPK
jgi:N-acylneuraminate cytidylyltransferase